MKLFLFIFMLLSIAFSSTVNVDTPYSSDSVSIICDVDTISFSSGIEAFFVKPDQTLYTNGGSGAYALVFKGSYSSIDYKDSEMDSLLIFKYTENTSEVDTIDILSGLMALYYNAWGPIHFDPMDGCDKVFYISQESKNTIRCQLLTELGQRTCTLVWETDSLGNGEFPSEGASNFHAKKAFVKKSFNGPVSVFSVNGRLIQEFEIFNPLNLKKLSTGTYILSDKKSFYSKKIMIRK